MSSHELCRIRWARLLVLHRWRHFLRPLATRSFRSAFYRCLGMVAGARPLRLAQPSFAAYGSTSHELPRWDSAGCSASTSALFFRHGASSQQGALRPDAHYAHLRGRRAHRGRRAADGVLERVNTASWASCYPRPGAKIKTRRVLSARHPVNGKRKGSAWALRSLAQA